MKSECRVNVSDRCDKQIIDCQVMVPTGESWPFNVAKYKFSICRACLIDLLSELEMKVLKEKNE